MRGRGGTGGLFEGGYRENSKGRPRPKQIRSILGKERRRPLYLGTPRCCSSRIRKKKDGVRANSLERAYSSNLDDHMRDVASRDEGKRVETTKKGEILTVLRQRTEKGETPSNGTHD